MKEFLCVPKSLKDDTKTEVIKLVFDKNASGVEQVKFALTYLNRLVKITDIEKAIKEFDSKFDKGLNTPLEKLKRTGVVKAYNPTGSNHTVFYGLKSWFNGEQPKQEYIQK